MYSALKRWNDEKVLELLLYKCSLRALVLLQIAWTKWMGVNNLNTQLTQLLADMPSLSHTEGTTTLTLLLGIRRLEDRRAA